MTKKPRATLSDPWYSFHYKKSGLLTAKFNELASLYTYLMNLILQDPVKKKRESLTLRIMRKQKTELELDKRPWKPGALKLLCISKLHDLGQVTSSP